MKKTTAIFLISMVLVLITSVLVYTYPTGITGRTRKTSTQGCSSCHTQNTSITAAITGPDSVNIGQTVVYSFTITRSGSTLGAGVDISTRLGALATGPGSSYLRLQNGELTHQNPFTLSSGSFTGQFNYTAPGAIGTDTLWLTAAVGHSNGWNWGLEKRIIVRSPLGINNNQNPAGYRLYQNYPNPFNPATKIAFEIPEKSNVKITIIDITGKEVETIINGEMAAGSHEVTWNASNYSSGVYLYKLESGKYDDVKKMLLIR